MPGTQARALATPSKARCDGGAAHGVGVDAVVVGDLDERGDGAPDANAEGGAEPHADEGAEPSSLAAAAPLPSQPAAMPVKGDVKDTIVTMPAGRPAEPRAAAHDSSCATGRARHVRRGARMSLDIKGPVGKRR